LRIKAVESADEDVVIDIVKSLGQVNEFGYTVLLSMVVISFRPLRVAEVHL
jgi:hypothetical protein